MPCILLIDDNSAVLQALEFFFQLEGYKVLLAPDGESGLRAAASTPVDIIMLDIEMPQMSGMDVCRALKANPSLARIPVVMMTGRPTRELIERATAAGATLALGKPFDLEYLRKTFAGLLGQAGESVAVPEVKYGEAK
jgi:two-component system phosphate regulon response regulator PhoB